MSNTTRVEKLRLVSGWLQTRRKIFETSHTTALGWACWANSCHDCSAFPPSIPAARIASAQLVAVAHRLLARHST